MTSLHSGSRDGTDSEDSAISDMSSKHSKSSTPGPGKTTPKSGHDKSKDGTKGVGFKEDKIDLTDPAAIMKALESSELSEEDTEELLRAAYEINRKLKQELSQRNMQQPMSRSQTIATSGMGGRSKNHNITGASLPPIQVRDQYSNGKRGNYSMQRQDSYARVNTNSLSRSTPNYSRQSSFTRSGSGKQQPGSGSRSQTKVRSSKPSPKPQWDDRFSFG